MTNGTKYVLKVDGDGDYVEVPDHRDLSLARDANCDRIGMTIHVEFRPDVLDFSKTDGTTDQYVNFIGKNNPSGDKREWLLRMYNKNSSRPNRISGYIFSHDVSKGPGSYFEEPVTVGEWIKVTMVVDHDYIYIYKNGIFKRCSTYSYIMPKSGCEDDPNRPVDPQHRDEPMRIGADYMRSFFQGAYREIRKYNKPFTPSQVAALNNGTFTDTTNLIFWHNYTLGNANDQSGKSHNGILHGNTHFELDAPPCPDLSCTISCPTSVVQGDVGTFSIVTSGGTSPFTYIWNITRPDNGIDMYTTQNVSYIFALVGTYSVSSKVTDSCLTGAKTCAKTCTVTVTTSPPVTSSQDKFGITKIYKSATNSDGTPIREWYSTWNNGHSRSWTDQYNDPDDPEFWTKWKGSGSWKTTGDGILKISGSAPRMYVVHTSDPNGDPANTSIFSGRWHNIEITLYGMRVGTSGNSYDGLEAMARTNHMIDTQLCDTRGVAGRFRIDGALDFEKEVSHPNSCRQSIKQYWPSGMPMNVWIGYKYVVYDLSDGNVKLELWMDTTDGANGGNWIKVNEFIDDGTNFPGATCIDGTSKACVTGIDSRLRLTSSDNRPGSETGKPNLAVYFRSDNVSADGLWYKKASIREIVSPI